MRQLRHRGIRFASSATGPYVRKVTSRMGIRAVPGFGEPVSFQDSDWILDTGVTVLNGVLTKVTSGSAAIARIENKLILNAKYLLTYTVAGTSIAVRPRIGSDYGVFTFEACDCDHTDVADTNLFGFQFSGPSECTVSNIVIRRRL